MFVTERSAGLQNAVSAVWGSRSELLTGLSTRSPPLEFTEAAPRPLRMVYFDLFRPVRPNRHHGFLSAYLSITILVLASSHKRICAPSLN